VSIVSIPGGSFCEETHTYRDDKGVWVPGLTSILALQGLSNGFGGADPAVIENASRRGSEVHALVAAWIKYGDDGMDPTWETEETSGYFSAAKSFINDTGFRPDPDIAEQPRIVTFHGMAFGLTPDAFGCRKPWPAVVEWKCTAAESKSWSLQTCAQEIGLFNSTICGRAKRMAVILKKDGKYKVCAHEDHAYDLQVFASALTCVYYRLRQGQRLWEVV